MSRVLFTSADEAVAQIKNGSTIAISGNGAGMITAEAILEALEKRFLTTGSPNQLTLVHSLGIGDRALRGTNRLAHEGMLKRVIAAHFTWSTKIQELVKEEKIEAYCFPGGAIQQLLREIGSGRPGLITPSGLGTFVDPQEQGGRCNARSKDTLVERVQLGGKNYLWYKPFKIDVAIIRGTYADTRGNISTEDEAIDLDVHSMALAAHNSGGQVIAQVKEVVSLGKLHARRVRIPGIMVNTVVENKNQEQFYDLPYDLSVSGSTRATLGSLKTSLPDKIERRIIALRASLELKKERSLNFGFGIPGGIFGAIAEQGISDQLWMSVEQGVHNGRMLDDRYFGAAQNPDAILPSIEQFDYYNGGGIDITFLGMGEADATGNVNVSHLGGTLVGPGGFIDIAQNAKKVVFCGTFDAQGSKVTWDGSKLSITQAGKIRKFINKVERITFSGAYSKQRKQEVLYVTERAVFSLKENGLHLIEIAPGIEIERDILPYMDFKPNYNHVAVMDMKCFR
jgi:acyl CoA:acetate/3-ketoacid CoA transferase